MVVSGLKVGPSSARRRLDRSGRADSTGRDWLTESKQPKIKAATTREYIAAAPKPAQKNLRAIYAILKRAAPKARETIKWRTPIFEEERILFAFAAYKSHVNFMPTPSAMQPFSKELAAYKTGKGSIQIPHDAPLPKVLIAKIARQRIKELREKDVRWM